MYGPLLTSECWGIGTVDLIGTYPRHLSLVRTCLSNSVCSDSLEDCGSLSHEIGEPFIEFMNCCHDYGELKAKAALVNN
jgi:hypothetical protein